MTHYFLRHLYSELVEMYNSCLYIGQVCDVVNDEIPLDEGSMDLVLCMFVLSAIAPEVSSTLSCIIFYVVLIQSWFSNTKKS